MKFLHIADLHLGKRYNELSLADDQSHALREIINAVKGEKPDGVLIAGDVYDKSIPSIEAVSQFDGFLSELAALGIKTFIISGNHDSAERLSFGSRLMAPCGVYSAPVFSGRVEPIILNDGYGEVAVYLLPFIKPLTARRYFTDRSIESYTDAVAAAIEQMDIDKTRRNVLVAHQFVTGAKLGGSEDVIVGDVGNVDASCFDVFDYVALGHIHGAQNVTPRVRYSGAPLKYSLNEAGHEKSITVVELGKKGELAVRTLPIKPMRELRELKGSYAQLTQRSFYEGTGYPCDLVHVVLTDEEEVPDALAKLRLIYPYVMSIRYDNTRTRAESNAASESADLQKSPLEMFASLYEMQNGSPMTEEQSDYVSALIQKLWEDGQ